jgi:hypothetical protein
MSNWDAHPVFFVSDVERALSLRCHRNSQYCRDCRHEVVVRSLSMNASTSRDVTGSGSF